MIPGHSLEPGWRVALEHLGEKERALEEACLEGEARYAGLIDIEDRLKLCQTRLAMCLVMMDAMTSSRRSGVRQRLYSAAAARAQDAIGDLEELRDPDVSEDQKSQIDEHPEYIEAQRLLGELMAEGGATLLQPLPADPARERAVSRAVSSAIRKYAAPDDRYVPLIPAGRRGGVLDGVGSFLFPTLFAEGTDDTPCGIEEEDEGLQVRERMRMPLSQAVLYTEKELLPSLRRALEKDPGEPQIQGRILGLERQLAELKRLRFTPRSTPVVLERGFHTVGITDYSPDGELLVTVLLPVTLRTGTNLGRAQELAIADIVRRLAGRGMCARLDAQYRYLRGLSSGIRGSSRLPSGRLHTRRGFAALKRVFPGLAALESPDTFRRLLAAAARGDRRDLETEVLSVLSGGPSERPSTAFLTP